MRELAALAIILAIGFLVWWLCSLVMTDRKQIEANMHTLANAALNAQPEKMASFLADRKYGGRTRAQIAEEVTHLAKSHGIHNYRISDFQIEKFDKEIGRAEATFMLRVDARDGQRPLRCWATFVFEEGKWCLESFAYALNPLAGDSEKRPAPMYTPDP